MRDFDSKEELHFSWYLDELVKLGVVSSYTNDIAPFILNKEYKVNIVIPMKRVPDKVKERIFIREHVYTPDFIVYWNKQVVVHKRLMDIFVIQQDEDGNLYTYFEIKGAWDQNNMTRLFTSRTQPWVWDKFNKYVQLLKVPNIFKKTFTPRRYLLTDKTSKPRSIKFKTVDLQTYLNN